MSSSRLFALISSIVLLTLAVAFGIVTLVLWLAGDWEEYSWGLWLTLKIMWGTWLIATAAITLTRVTMFGWQFRKLRPDAGPRALAMALAAEIKPASWFKSGSTSFAITVVLVSLTGAAFLASLLIWIIGDWRESRRALEVSYGAIWGSWWVLCIIIVLIRIGLFTRQRRLAKQANEQLAKRDVAREVPQDGADDSTPTEKEPVQQPDADGNADNPGARDENQRARPSAGGEKNP